MHFGRILTFLKLLDIHSAPLYQHKTAVTQIQKFAYFGFQDLILACWRIRENDIPI